MRFLILLITICSGLVYGQQLRIGVFRDNNIKQIVFAYDNGSYNVFGDTSYFATILPSEFVDLSVVGTKISLKIGVEEVAQVDKVVLVSSKLNQSLVYSPKFPSLKERKYKDDVEVVVKDGNLVIVNLVDINNYLSGVVESEGGSGKDIEYYKVQALMSRTYAMKYANRHAKEGFDLCDRVHCQAYHYQMRFNPIIDTAVYETQGMVMVDSSGKLVDAYFHANCGGQTSEPDYVWNNKISYLSTFKDTFCIYTKQATWEKRIPQAKWREFLVERYHYPIEDSILGPMIYTFSQPDRFAFYQYPWLGIPLRDIREYFELKSTFFNCYPEGDVVVLRGRGYGHGVGLCQEGAMKMAKYHFNYIQIALYYFPGVKVVNLNQLQYFSQKAKTSDFD